MKANIPLIEPIPIKTTKQPNIDHHNQSGFLASLYGFDRNVLSFLIGIAAGIIVLAILVLILALIIRRKRKRNDKGKCMKPLKLKINATNFISSFIFRS